MGETISDWIIAGKNKGLEGAVKDFHTEKLEDDRRLIESGLPVFDRFETPYSDFFKQNKALMKFLSRYNSFIIRALPVKGKNDLPRRPKIGLHSFEECKKFLLKLFSEDKAMVGNEKFYNVSLVEHAKNRGSGIIVSNPRKVLVDLGKCNLEQLSHGYNPTLSCNIDLTGVGHITDKIKWLIEGNPRDKEIMWKALRYIELSRDTFNPYYMRGYFEFIILEKDRIVFWDYKINPMYLK